MDLKKFKLISAILLAGTLLFLSVIMMINKKEADNLPFSAAEDLSALFATRGVELSPELVPLKREKLSVYSCPAADGAEAQKIAETISSSTRLAANLTEDGYLFRLENGAMIEVSSSLKIIYSKNGYQNDRFDVTYPPTDAAKAKADAFISRFVSQFESADDLICTYTLTEYAFTEDNTLLRFDISLNGVPIDGNSLTVYQDSNGEVFHASGKCAFFPLKKESGFKHYDIINVLKTEFDNITENGNVGTEIESIEACYVMRRSADESRILFLPAWKIKYVGGATRLHESVSGESR